MEDELRIYRAFFFGIASIPPGIISNFDKVKYMRKQVEDCKQLISNLKINSSIPPETKD